jgi:hypothetical protein
MGSITETPRIQPHGKRRRRTPPRTRLLFLAIFGVVTLVVASNLMGRHLNSASNKGEQAMTPEAYLSASATAKTTDPISAAKMETATFALG